MIIKSATATVATVATDVIVFHLYVPNKTDPYSTHNTIREWSDAYENIADLTSKAGKRPARERMTLIKELQECNQDNLKRVDTTDRVRHISHYQSRIRALGAAQ